jgi:uncharacterized protein YceK
MKIKALLLGIALLGFSGCSDVRSDRSASNERAGQSKSVAANSAQETSTKTAEPMVEAETRTTLADSLQPVSLKDADSANVASQAFERKIIRNANLSVEVASPIEVQRKIVSIAETHQGFVVTSESIQRTDQDTTKPLTTVNLTVRVPATQFNQTMEEIRATGNRVILEKVTGQDVTEEFMDLDARIKNQKALEVQFLEIMKRAGKVEDALSVQSELAEVRTEIEKLEGRRRFLENQSSLSTINVSLQSPTQIVNATGFWYSVKSAFSDGVDAASAIVLALIRVIVGLVPIIVLFVLPIGLITNFVIRRRRRSLREEANATATTG